MNSSRPNLTQIVLALLCSICLINICSAQNNWTQWRGPTRDSTLTEVKLPEKISKDYLTEVWSVELGPSYSSPIVTSDKVFVTETIDKKQEQVTAFDRSTGEKLWQYQWEGSISVPFFAKANGDWIRATPIVEENRLYVAGIRDLLVCLDTKSGKELWRYDFVDQLKSNVPAFGFVCSPLIIKDAIYVQAGEGFCKLDKKTGELKWRVLQDGGGMFGSAFSSPYFTTISKVPQIVVQTRTKLAGVDPAEGTVLWEEKIPAFRGMNILTPTVFKDQIFTSSYGGKSLLLNITQENPEDWDVNVAWENKAQGYMSSPVLIDGHVYLHLRNQRFTCIHLATGETTFTTTPFGKYWSMVTDGEKILALDEEGKLLLIRANPEEFELLDEREVAENTWAHVAVAKNQIFIRALDKLMVYQWK